MFYSLHLARRWHWGKHTSKPQNFKMIATLYLPGQAAQLVTLTTNTPEAAALHMGLAPQLVDVLAGAMGDLTVAPGYTVYAHGDTNENTPFNELATEQLDMLLGAWCEASGPVLIVQD